MAARSSPASLAAMNDWHPTNWKPPRTESNVRVRFRNGETSKHTYPPKSLNWSDRNWDFDVTHWREE